MNIMRLSMALPTVKSRVFCAAGAILMIALAAASLFVGKYPLTLEGLLSGDVMQLRVFWTLRASRTAVGVIGGFALGAAGFVYQTVFRNPLASPDVIGVSSGASAGAAAGILFLSGAAAVTASAFAGALLSGPCGKKRHDCAGWHRGPCAGADRAHVPEADGRSGTGAGFH